MGYTTEFEGRFNLDKPLSQEHADYLRAFNGTRRMLRDEAVCEKLDDPVRVSAGLPVGKDGMYFVGGGGFRGQGRDGSVLDHNGSGTMPGLWCQWVPTEDCAGIEWDEGEKFCDYTEWLRFIVDHFLRPWGYVLNGEVKWSGEDDEDMGKLIAENNSSRC